ncbi:nucleoside hydrolase-like isoform X3 [Dermacentor albipictus]|uniref:nucleoside hydrolase-like isoform X3 n=1 Tax=Dermacentor albipictus TaxID=60249 RepID=UPI0038FC0B01
MLLPGYGGDGGHFNPRPLHLNQSLPRLRGPAMSGGDSGQTVRDRRLVLDVDCGVDDALALVLALSLHSTVEAVTCVAGNTTVRNVVKNVHRVLAVCGRKDVPVYRGCEQPLSQPLDFADQYHGCDGLGDVQDQFPCTDDDEDDDDGSVDGRPMHAAEKLIEMARREPGQITLLLLGPLTNAALALTLDPRFGANLKEIFILGGNVEGRGNVLPGAEFNFKADPEAANVVLTRAQCPITIVPWEAVVKSPIPWEVYSMMTRQDTAKSRFVSAITRFTLRYYDDVASGGYEVGDALAVAAVLAPDSVASALEHRRVAVELGGVHTRGQLVHAWTPDLLPDVKRTVRVVTAFNKERVSELLMRMVV